MVMVASPQACDVYEDLPEVSFIQCPVWYMSQHSAGSMQLESLLQVGNSQT